MASAVYFWGYEFTKEAIGPSVGSTAGIVLGGMCAQAAAGLIYTPMDVIKERQQARLRLEQGRKWRLYFGPHAQISPGVCGACGACTDASISVRRRCKR